MTEPNGAAKDTETDGVVPKPLTASRLAALCAAGFAGGVLGAVGLGLAGALLRAGSARGKIIETVGLQAWLGGMVGGVLGLPLGVAVGLHAAGKKLGIRGRFRSALVGAYAGLLASLGPALFLHNLMIRGHVSMAAAHYLPFLLYTTPFVLSLAGGLVGYLRTRRPGPVDSTRPPVSLSSPR